MHPSHWKKIDAILNEALSLPARDRSAFLDQACEGDGAVREEVENMLSMMEEADNEEFLAKPLFRWDGGKEMEGREIGPYRLQKAIGEGGMGQVYLADQTCPFRRLVALKLIKPGMSTQAVVERFQNEQQVLARLNHPYIAQVYDAGVTEEGQPYFAMEYVSGMPITQWCEENKLSIEARLDLMIKVCHAIQYAHQQGTIHRDIKPANVLVTLHNDQAIPKVIDFGIAKATAPNMSAAQTSIYQRANLTQAGMIFGSLGYMSPEQTLLTDAEVDTRTDIYSLGALLYEVITGGRPLQFNETMSWDQVCVMIRQTPPTRPVLRVEQGANPQECAHARNASLHVLKKAIRGDLERIILKSLEKEKDRRYASVSELAEDLSRFSRHEPILAKPPGWAYLLGKLIQRHKLAFFASLLVTTGLMVGIVGATTGAAQARKAEGEAREEALKARQTLQLMKDFLSSADPEKHGRDIMLSELLNTFSAELEDREGAGPEVLAEIHHTVGVTYESLGLYSKALHYLDQAWKQRTEVLGPDHPHTLATQSEQGLVLQNLGRYTDAVQLLEKTAKQQRATLGLQDPATLKTIKLLAVALTNAGKYKEAEALYLKANPAMEAVHGPDGEETLNMLNNLANLKSMLGLYREAEELHGKVLECRIRRYGRNHLKTIGSLLNLARAYQQQERYEEAEPLCAEALAERETQLGREHPETLDALNVWAVNTMRLGRYQEAEQAFREAIEIGRKTRGDLLSPMNNLAYALFMQDKKHEALAQTHDLVILKRERLGSEHPDTLITMGNEAWLMAETGDIDQAKTLNLDIFNKSLETQGKLHPNTLNAMDRMIGVHQKIEDWENALIWAEKALQFRRELPKMDSDTLNNIHVLADLYFDAEQVPKAITLYEECLKGYEKLRPQDPRIAEIRTRLKALREASSHSRDLKNKPIDFFKKR